MKTKSLLGIVVLFVVCFSSIGFSAPFFTSVGYYTENNPNLDSGYVVQYGTQVYDDNYEIISVTSTRLDTNETVPLGGLVNYSGVWKWNTEPVANYKNLPKQLMFTAINSNNDHTYAYTHILDHPQQLPFIKNLTISDSSLTPTISWEPILEAESYELRLYDNSVEFWRSPHTSASSFVIPEGVLSLDKLYTVRLLANDLDYENGTWFLENRSSVYATFKTSSIPDPFATHSLSIKMAGSGIGAVASWPVGLNCVEDCSESFYENTLVTIAASPISDYAFNGWDGECIGVSPTCTLTMDAAKDVTAHFGDLYTRRYEKISAYFVATLGRPATADELESWSMALDAYNGNVWKAGLVAYLNDNGTEHDLASLTTGKTHTQIVQTLYANMVGEAPHADVLSFYVNHLNAGTIKVRGLANAILNDMGLMPRIDGVYTRPFTWTTDLSMYLDDSHRDTMKHRVEVARYFTDLVAASQPEETRTTGARLISKVTSALDNVMALKSTIYVISIGGDPNDSDDDGDWYTDNQGDCNDAVSSINPAATEICGDGIDQDCSGNDMACSTPGDDSMIPGTWSGIAGLGEIGFVVSSDGRSIEKIIIDYNNFKCGSVTRSDRRTINHYPAKLILERTLIYHLKISSDVSMDIIGTFASTGNFISGTFDYHGDSLTCHGVWTASPL